MCQTILMAEESAVDIKFLENKSVSKAKTIRGRENEGEIDLASMRKMTDIMSLME